MNMIYTLEASAAELRKRLDKLDSQVAELKRAQDESRPLDSNTFDCMDTLDTIQRIVIRDIAQGWKQFTQWSYQHGYTQGRK